MNRGKSFGYKGNEITLDLVVNENGPIDLITFPVDEKRCEVQYNRDEGSFEVFIDGILILSYVMK